MQYTFLRVRTIIAFTGTSAAARFTNESCTTGGVQPNDPLLFTCQLYRAILLRVVLPSGGHEIISIGDTVADVALPSGFDAVSLTITETDNFRNFDLTLSISTASLLEGGEITCDDTTPINQAGARCPIIGKFKLLSGVIECNP